MLLMLSLLEANFRDWERLFFIPDLIAAMLRYAVLCEVAIGPSLIVSRQHA
jgi:hypothetical protein